MPRTSTVQAWVVGEHELPDDNPFTFALDGEVIVQDEHGGWHNMTRAAFDSEFVWA